MSSISTMLDARCQLPIVEWQPVTIISNKPSAGGNQPPEKNSHRSKEQGTRKLSCYYGVDKVPPQGGSLHCRCCTLSEMHSSSYLS